jgi:putative sterol carrier protein
MPRPKGSKNKKTLSTTATLIESFDEQIAAVNKEIDELNASLKAKKADLKKLTAKKLKAEKAAAERKLEEDKEKILAAIKESGKSAEEIIELLK